MVAQNTSIFRKQDMYLNDHDDGRPHQGKYSHYHFITTMNDMYDELKEFIERGESKV